MKLHQDQNHLQTKISEGLNSRQIANELNVSYKLVELYLVKYNIEHESQKERH